MEVASAVGLVLLTLAGYSSGCAIGAGRGRHVPGLFDLAVVVALWIAAFSLRAELGHWPGLGASVLMGIAVGAARVALGGRPAAAPPREPEVAGFRAGWKRFALEMGNVQGRLTMAFFYFGVVTPFALLARLLAGPSRAAPGARSYWIERAPIPPELERARHQF